MLVMLANIRYTSIYNSNWLLYRKGRELVSSDVGTNGTNQSDDFQARIVDLTPLLRLRALFHIVER